MDDPLPVLARPDRAWRAFVLHSASRLEPTSRTLKVIGSGPVMLPVRVAVAIRLGARRRPNDLAAWLLGWALADLIAFVLGSAVGRLRPDGADTSSFPSAHAKTAAQVAFGLVLVGPGPWRRRTPSWFLASAWTSAIALSRTVLDEHWLSDVIAGSLLGAGCAIGAAAIVQRNRAVGAPSGA